MKFNKLSSILEANKSSDLNKCYICIKRSSGHRWWTFKGFAGSKYFLQITENNIDKIDFDLSMPILNYSSDIINKLIKRGAKLENIINKPEDIMRSGSKKQFHEFIGNDINLPITVFNKKDALDKISFPIIGKPQSGHSGIGIQIYNNEKEFNSADHSKIDVYSEYIDKKSEHRYFLYNGDPFFWMERTASNNKAKSGKGSIEDKMDFNYTKHNINRISKKHSEVLKKYAEKLKEFKFICFDLMEDNSGKVYIIESNCQPGVPFDSTIKLYKKIFKDFYKRDIGDNTNKILDKLSDELNKKTLEKNKGRFKISK